MYDMVLAVQTEHARWFGKKCKIGYPRTTWQNQNRDHIYTITRVSISINFDESGNFVNVGVERLFYAYEDGKQAGFTERPDLDLVFLD